MDAVIEFLRAHRDEHLRWLKDLCRIPSVSTQEQHAGDVRRAVEWTADLCRRIGLEAAVEETGGHPTVYAEWTGAAGAPTFLVYGHVDVQPPGPLDLWNADPFEPLERDGWLIARGSADDKGQVLLYLRAIQAWLSTHQRLPVNLKLLIEGEEEIGSPHLAPYVEQHHERLACAGILISDTGLIEDGYPTITTGTRGLCYEEVRIHGPKHNLHSGSHGGPVTNPANALARIIASLHDETGRVNLPGFYDDVVEPSEDERRAIASLPFDEQRYAEELGVPGLSGGEREYSVLERRTIRPTLDVNGIYGGYMDEGASTVIPAMAGAKVSMRLVPNQSAERIRAAFEQAVRQRCPQDVRVEIIHHGHADAYVTPQDWRALRAGRRALAEAFGREPALLREGGSLPILPMFKKTLGADCLMLGFASPNCNAHGPNEQVNLADLDRGAEAIARMLGYLADASG